MKAFFSRSALVRNFVFGVEDSLVSTVGLVSGIATAGVSGATILTTGIVLVLVEAFSMAVGSLVADNSVEEVSQHREISYTSSEGGALVMFASYTGSGLLVVLPYVFLPVWQAFWSSIGLALALLFLLGVFAARLAGISLWSKGFQTALIGGAAIAIGSGVGFLFR